MLRKRFVSKLPLLVATAALFMLLTQGVAFARSYLHLLPYYTCSDSCDGQPPTYLNCNSGAFQVSHGVAYIFGTGSRGVSDYVAGEVDLMYSSACGTNWAHVKLYSGSAQLFAEIMRADGKEEDSNASSSVTTWDSPMIFSPSLAAQACESTSYPGEFGACTPAI
jgi:hypothetical protein